MSWRSAPWLLVAWSAGCAGWLGDLPPLQVDAERSAAHPVQRATATLFVELPGVVDHDEEKDFTPIADKFAASLQARLAEYICARGAFARCVDRPSAGAYRLSVQVRMNNFRQSHGGYGVAVLGGLLPPLLGLAWSFPVAMGTCEYQAELVLRAPGGEELWRAENIIWEGADLCTEGENVARHFMWGLDDALPAMATAAAGAEELAERSRAAARPAEVAAAPPGPGPAARRKVLAVFDVQDLTGRVQEQELTQLTALLSTVMAATGKFTVVPREQLRDRLMDEKKAGYRQCFDSACQIELGKAVSAEKTLATQLLQVGDKCAVVANLYDLRTETATSAAMVQTGCATGELLDAMRQVGDQLSRKAE